MIHYQIDACDPKAHLFSVTLLLSQPAKNQRLTLPAWIPGSYMVRDFARNLIGLSASTAGHKVGITQLDKQTWQLDCNGTAPVSIKYQVYAFDLSVRSAHLDMTHGFFNGSSVFLAVEGQEQLPHRVSISAPKDSALAHWRLATTLPRSSGEAWGFGEFEAESYDALIDHPVEMGDFTLASFEARGVPHHVVLSGRHRCHMDRLCQDLKAICETQIDMFATPAPFSEYLFMTTVLDNGFGGLEHRSSTALVCSRKDLPLTQDAEVNRDYRVYLSLCSHEYFHSWNVKRIKPKRFLPYELAAESYTRQLWAYEGITSYYDDLLTLRAGRVDVSQYLDMLSETMTRVYRGTGRFKQSLLDSSFNAWTKFYKQDENAQNAIVSYYTKGALFALMLDLVLRRDAGKSLDDVMRLLWQRHGLTAIGTDDDTHQQLVSELLGRDAAELFAWLDNTEDLPLAELLAEFGVRMELRAASGQSDNGGGKPTPLKLSLGAKYKAEGLGVRIQTVAEGGAAHSAGLSAGDLLIAADGLQVNGNFESLLQGFEPGGEITLHWFRRDELMTGSLPLRSAPLDTVSLHLEDESKIKAWLDC
ncbi:M61 family metallopeptidase [Shewanella sedimentimangrovi]|uniref:M61 family metallopeptidase n=1 Tax=Shewanella sedimentimangrovi TaxID=2814293 RepID=A0ABX7QWF6_9GAMM|nr:PDZ domain-containing protein [Shewanella sedimentimangrovi]QSX35837.1 M61 family metallopeptidase [Shewanella sedimentimangrovi]